MRILKQITVFLWLCSGLITRQCFAQSTSVSINPSADTFVLMQNPTSNYGAAGALNVSGSAATNANGSLVGLCCSLIRFSPTNAVGAFNAAFGSNQWTLAGVVLQLNENAIPDNAIFGRGVGVFEIDWIASDSWVEGTGIPRQPTTDGAAWQDIPSILQPGTFLSVGQFTNNSFNGPLAFNLYPAAPLVSNIMAGSDVNFYLSAVSDGIGFTFNSRNFGNTNDVPTLVLTAIAQNSPPTLAIAPLGSNQVVLTFTADSNQTCQLQTTSSLAADANWTTILTHPAALTNDVVTFTESATNSQRFYRVSMQPGN